MAQDTVKITAQFRVFPEGDVIALWDEGGLMLQSYMHIGQHSYASRNLLDTLDKAKPHQMLPLLDELQRIGYDVTVTG